MIAQGMTRDQMHAEINRIRTEGRAHEDPNIQFQFACLKPDWKNPGFNESRKALVDARMRFHDQIGRGRPEPDQPTAVA